MAYTRVTVKLWSSDPGLLPANVFVHTTSQNTVGDIRCVLFQRLEASGTSSQSHLDFLYRTGRLADTERIAGFHGECRDNETVYVRVEKAAANVDSGQRRGRVNLDPAIEDFQVSCVTEYFAYATTLAETALVTPRDLVASFCEYLAESRYGVQKSDILTAKLAWDPNCALYVAELHADQDLSGAHADKPLRELLGLETDLPLANVPLVRFLVEIQFTPQFVARIAAETLEVRLIMAEFLKDKLWARHHVAPSTSIADLKSAIVATRNKDQLPGLAASDLKIISSGQFTDDATPVSALARGTSYAIVHLVVSVDYMDKYKEQQKRAASQSQSQSSSRNSGTPQREESFWEQVRSGKAFEFLPKEPYYSDDEEHVATRAQTSPETSDGVPNEAPAVDKYANRPPAFTAQLQAQAQAQTRAQTQVSSQSMSQSQTQTQTQTQSAENGFAAAFMFSSKLIRVAVKHPLTGTRHSVQLTTSEAIVNTKGGYLMLSPTGFARLSNAMIEVGVGVEPPRIVPETSPAPAPTPTVPTERVPVPVPVALPEPAAQPVADPMAAPVAQPVAEPVAEPAPNGGFAHFAALFRNIDWMALGVVFVDGFTMVCKYVLLTLILSSAVNPKYELFVALGVFVLMVVKENLYQRLRDLLRGPVANQGLGQNMNAFFAEFLDPGVDLATAVSNFFAKLFDIVFEFCCDGRVGGKDLQRVEEIIEEYIDNRREEREDMSEQQVWLQERVFNTLRSKLMAKYGNRYVNHLAGTNSSSLVVASFKDICLFFLLLHPHFNNRFTLKCAEEESLFTEGLRKDLEDIYGDLNSRTNNAGHAANTNVTDDQTESENTVSEDSEATANDPINGSETETEIDTESW